MQYKRVTHRLPIAGFVAGLIGLGTIGIASAATPAELQAAYPTVWQHMSTTDENCWGPGGLVERGIHDFQVNQPHDPYDLDRDKDRIGCETGGGPDGGGDDDGDDDGSTTEPTPEDTSSASPTPEDTHSTSPKPTHSPTSKAKPKAEVPTSIPAGL
jgi:hypothetical protein